MCVSCFILEINDENIIDWLDNFVFDGFDVDNYFCDRVKCWDMFIFVIMLMIWEFIFICYFFGMDWE